jgi:hypothetical protein
MKRVRPVTVLLLALILVLGYCLVIRQRREARLRAALALYKVQAKGDLDIVLSSKSRKAALDWPDGTSLGEVVKRIADSPPARRVFPLGLPILVDTDGLREVGQTLDSPVKAPPGDPTAAEPLALEQTLRILLEPLYLAAEVKDGAIVITSRDRVDQSAAASEEE